MIDLLVLWNWEFDADFVRLLTQACERRSLSCVAVGESELATLPAALESGALQAGAALDRAWEDSPAYAGQEAALHQFVPRLVNDHADVRKILNKPSVHYLFMRHGFYVPYLMVVPSVRAAPIPPPIDLAPLGGRFSAKGAHGGGAGVLRSQHQWEDVLLARQDWPDDETILQAWVEPRMLGGRRAWFRVFYACGRTLPCWADDRTHLQTRVSPDDEQAWNLGVLHTMTAGIAELCGLNAFSTEIALDENDTWKIIDYVNEPCDYRLKSVAFNGVPDDVVGEIVDAIAEWTGSVKPV